MTRPANSTAPASSRDLQLPAEARSLWEANRPSLRFASLQGRRTADVAVVGAGIAGLTAAVHLASRGASVVVLDAGRIGGGVTSVTTGKVTALHGANLHHIARQRGAGAAREYFDLNARAVATVRRLADRYAPDARFEARTAYTYGRDGRQEIADEHRTLTAVGARAHLPTELPLPYDPGLAVSLGGQGQFDPVAYLVGLARAAETLGVVLCEDSTATELGGLSSSSVITAGGRVDADRVLLTCGIPFTFRGAYFARSKPHRSYALGVELDGPPPEGLFLGIDPPVRSLRTAIDPQDGSRLLIVSGGGHVTGRGDGERELRTLLEWARRRFAVRAVRYRWSAQDYGTPDRLPYVGAMSRLPSHVLVATGFNKWGMTNGTAAGTTLAERVLADAAPPRSVRSTRLPTAGSLGAFATINGSAVAHLVRGRLGAPGTATVVEDGVEVELDLTCPHMGGRPCWNPAEQTWDCPVHGARFGRDGRRLQGPAKDGLRVLRRRRITPEPPSS